MKTALKLSAILFIALASSCGNNSKSASGAADSTTQSAKTDTAIVPGNQKDIKNDSVSGDPASKGAADPNAKLPKK